MLAIPKVLFSNCILSFLEHPQDDTSVRKTCKEWRDLFPKTLNLCTQAVTINRLYFLIQAYQNRKSTFYSIRTTLRSMSGFSADPPELTFLEKLTLKNDGWNNCHWHHLGVYPDIPLKELYLEGPIDWSTLTRVKWFTNLHTLTLIQTLHTPFGEYAESLRSLKELRIEKLTIDDPNVNELYFDTVLEFPHLKELTFRYLPPELFINNGYRFRQKALKTPALKWINGHFEDLWRPLLINASDADLSAQLRPLQDEEGVVDRVAPADPLEGAPFCLRLLYYCLVRPWEILYDAIEAFVECFIGFIERFIRYFIGE